MKRTKTVFGLMLAMVIVAGLAGCGKYEDGPSFTLASKKARLEGEWKLFKYDGNEVATPWVKTFRSDGTYKEVITIVTGPVTYEGTWAFLDGKEVVIATIQNVNVEHRIRRLTKDEFWFISEDGKLWEMVRP